jgi:hypothetical protein
MTYAELVRKYHPEADTDTVMQCLMDCGITIWQYLNDEDEERIKNWKEASHES